MLMIRKLLSLIMAICTLISITACGRDKSGTPAPPEGQATVPEWEISAPISTPTPTEDTSAIMNVEAVFTEEANILPEGAVVKSVINLGGNLALLWTENDQEKLGLVPYSMDDNGTPSLGSLLEVAYEHPFEDCLGYALSTAGDGSFYLLCGDNREGAALSLAVLGFDSAGNCTGSMEIQWRYQTVDSFCAGPNGLLTITAGRELSICGWGQGEVGNLELGQEARATFLTSQGIAFAGLDQDNVLFACQILNPETQELSTVDVYSFIGADDKAIRNCLINGAYSLAPCQGLYGEMLINSQGIICALDLEMGQAEKLLSWNTAGSLFAQYGPACRLGERAFACVLDGQIILTWEGTMEKLESGRLRVGVVEAGAMGHIEQELMQHSSSDIPYTLEVSTFSSDEAGLSKFQGELAAGSFDLVVFSDGVKTMNNEFVDLYTYLDADGDISRENFLPGLLEGLSTNGKLTEIWNGVMIMTLAGRESLVGDGTGLTVADCRQIVQDSGSVQSILDNKLSDQGGLRSDTLQNLAWTAACAFVDKNSASCSFDSREFKDLLELCGTIKANPDSTGSDFLLNVVQVANAGALDYLEQMLGPCSYVGYPNGGQGVHYYSLNIAGGRAMAIPANGQNKDGAWGFIKYMLSESVQWEVARGAISIPVIRSVAEEYNRQNYNQEQYDKLATLIERTRFVQTGADATVREMIIEVCQPYLAGDKSLEETAKLLQSRVSIYMAEQYG